MSLSGVLIVAGAYGWILGYLRTGSIRKGAQPYEKTFVRPPTILYYGCGLPRAHNVPRGAMTVTRLGLQLMGLFWAVLGLVNFLLPVRYSSLLGVALIIGSVLIGVYCWILSRGKMY